MLFANPLAARRPYDAALAELMNAQRARECRRWLSGWPMVRPGPTAVWELPALARRLSLGRVAVKDESRRSPLGSFKALGAPVALLRLIQRRSPRRSLLPEDLLAGRHAADVKDFVAVSATDGNHGRALAAAARSIGCKCVIVLHAQVSVEREAPIAALGAQVVRVDGNYDASVQEAARLARQHGWEVVSDTSYEGYEEVPCDVMQGYGVIADELLEHAPADEPCPCSHVFLQGGVGGLAAGVVSYFWQRYGAGRPTFIVVEPEQADCLLESARSGHASRTRGSVDSLMAGLACGEASPLAWRFLGDTADFFMTVTDAQAQAAMRAFAEGAAGDVPIVSGESGAAGLAGLACLMDRPRDAARCGLDGRSRVLLLNTEGATAAGMYERIVGRSAQAVLRAQVRWEQGR